MRKIRVLRLWVVVWVDVSPSTVCMDSCPGERVGYSHIVWEAAFCLAERGSKASGSEYLSRSTEHQLLHTDLCYPGDKKRHEKTWPPPLLAVNLIVSEYGVANGAIRIIARQKWDGFRDPVSEEQFSVPDPLSTDIYEMSVPAFSEPAAWRASQVDTLQPGDVLLRLPSVWHGGCPNWSNRARIMPEIMFAPTSFVERAYAVFARDLDELQWYKDW